MTKHEAAQAADAHHYDRSKVVQIVHSVISKMEGLSGESMRTLVGELQSLVEAIEKTRSELAQARTHEVGKSHVPTATDELDAVVEATRGATDSIMGACEAMEKFVAGRGDEVESKITEEVTKIYEACSFQDITGQRIKKVVTVLREVEGKVGHLLMTLGHDTHAPQLAVKETKAPATDQDLMNGPQLPANAISQEEIDKLLASFD